MPGKRVIDEATLEGLYANPKVKDLLYGEVGDPKEGLSQREKFNKTWHPYGIFFGEGGSTVDAIKQRIPRIFGSLMKNPARYISGRLTDEAAFFPPRHPMPNVFESIQDWNKLSGGKMRPSKEVPIFENIFEQYAKQPPPYVRPDNWQENLPDPLDEMNNLDFNTLENFLEGRRWGSGEPPRIPPLQAWNQKGHPQYQDGNRRTEGWTWDWEKFYRKQNPWSMST